MSELLTYLIYVRQNEVYSTGDRLEWMKIYSESLTPNTFETFLSYLRPTFFNSVRNVSVYI